MNLGKASWVALLAIGLPACATSPASRPQLVPLLEVGYDDGPAVDKPTLPGEQLELLVHVDPRLPQYRLKALRFLLAQHGRLVWSLYRLRPDGRPGELAWRRERAYGADWVTSSEPGQRRWVVEPLDDAPITQGPFLLGLFAPGGHDDPRLWSARNESGAVWERELDGTLGRVRRTPMIRVQLDPSGL